MSCAWERLRKFRFIASVLLETNHDMCLGKTKEILVQASPELSTTAMTHEPTRLGRLMTYYELNFVIR